MKCDLFDCCAVAIAHYRLHVAPLKTIALCIEHMKSFEVHIREGRLAGTIELVEEKD